MDLTPKIEAIHMLSERCHTKNRVVFLKQHIKYFNFQSKIQLDHPVRTIPRDVGCRLDDKCRPKYVHNLCLLNTAHG